MRTNTTTHAIGHQYGLSRDIHQRTSSSKLLSQKANWSTAANTCLSDSVADVAAS